MKEWMAIVRYKKKWVRQSRPVQSQHCTWKKGFIVIVYSVLIQHSAYCPRAVNRRPLGWWLVRAAFSRKDQHCAGYATELLGPSADVTVRQDTRSSASEIGFHHCGRPPLRVAKTPHRITLPVEPNFIAQLVSTTHGAIAQGPNPQPRVQLPLPSMRVASEGERNTRYTHADKKIAPTHFLWRQRYR